MRKSYFGLVNIDKIDATSPLRSAPYKKIKRREVNQIFNKVRTPKG